MRNLLSMLTLTLLLLTVSRLVADESVVADSTRVLVLPAKTLPDAGDTLRLLPTYTECKQGNAAVILLRMIWERQAYWNTGWAKTEELFQLPQGDRRIARELSVDHFVRQLEQAAYLRSADWNYPLDSSAPGSILLPDLQGGRHFFRGLRLWVRNRIDAGEIDRAVQGIKSGIACARHYGRTPVMVNHHVSQVMAGEMLNCVEDLIQHPSSPNLYYALALLPNRLGDWELMLEWEAAMLPNSLPALGEHLPDIGSDRWDEIAAQFDSYLSWKPQEREASTSRMKNIAATELSATGKFKPEEIESMSPNEQMMRWMLGWQRRINTEVQFAYTLSPPMALDWLAAIEERIENWMDRVAAPASPFMRKPVESYVFLNQFHRRANILQVVEAIRHELASSGQMPKTLDDLKETPIGLDPLTGEPFEYLSANNEATLRAPPIPHLNDQSAERFQIAYQIKLANE